MGLTMAERKAVTRELAQEYRRGSRREKGETLDRLVKLNGWTRHHAAWMLRCWSRTVYSWQGGRLVKIVVGRATADAPPAPALLRRGGVCGAEARSGSGTAGCAASGWWGCCGISWRYW